MNWILTWILWRRLWCRFLALGRVASRQAWARGSIFADKGIRTPMRQNEPFGAIHEPWLFRFNPLMVNGLRMKTDSQGRKKANAIQKASKGIKSLSERGMSRQKGGLRTISAHCSAILARLLGSGTVTWQTFNSCAPQSWWRMIFALHFR